MKTGPNWYPVTNSGGQVMLVQPANSTTPFPSLVANATPTQVYNMQNVTASMTSLPVECRGLYDKTFQLSATTTAAMSSTTQVVIEVSLDGNAVGTPTQVIWYPVATLTNSNTLATHAGIVRAMRARTTGVSNSDNFSVLWMGDDRG